MIQPLAAQSAENVELLHESPKHSVGILRPQAKPSEICFLGHLHHPLVNHLINLRGSRGGGRDG